MKKKMLKNQNGITLIALVVTIVVLLILAGVSISMLTGENGIITQANKAKENTRGGEVQEVVNIAVTNNEMLDNTNTITGKQTREQVIEKLYTDKKITEKEYNQLMGLEGESLTNIITIGDIEVDFSKLGSAGKTLVEMFKQAQTDGCTLTHETCTNEDHLHIGDYLKYIPVAGTSASVEPEKTGHAETQTYTVDTSTTWRVLGLNDDETELIITSGSPIKKDGADPYLYLKGAYAYAYCEETLDKICGIYRNDYASQVKSMRIEDINRALGIVKEGNVVYKKDDASKTNIDQWGVLGETYTYEDGDYAPENYLYTAGDTTQTQKSVGDTVTGTAYYYNYTDSNIIDQNSVLWKVLFDGTTNYWLASPGVLMYFSCARFGPGNVDNGFAGAGIEAFRSDGVVYERLFAVRPVVSLKSNITESEIEIITGTEPDWTTLIPDNWTGENISSGQVLGSSGESGGSGQN